MDKSVRVESGAAGLVPHDRHTEAAHLFQKGAFAEAASAYTAGIEALATDGADEERTTLLNNRAACYLRLVSNNYRVTSVLVKRIPFLNRIFFRIQNVVKEK